MGFDLSVKNGALKSDSSGNMIMRNTAEDGDIKFYVNDGGTDTLALQLDGAANELISTSILDIQAVVPATTSAGHLLKETLVPAGFYDGTHAGLKLKMYDPDNTVDHAESELAALYINLKQLSAMTAGGKSALISAHNYGSGGDYQVLDFGLRLFGDIVDGVELSGGTVTNAIKLDTATALTNIFKLADGVGCVVGSMTAKSPESDAEAAYIKITIDGTSYEIPAYAIA